MAPYRKKRYLTYNKKRYYKKKKAPITASKKKMTYRKRTNFSVNRSAIVETKKQFSGVQTTYLSNDITEQPAFLPPVSFLNYQQGLGEQFIIGQSIFSKYFSMKIKFDFPSDAQSIKDQYKIQLIHGWMTAPFALDSTFAPKKESPTRQELDMIMEARLKPNWNSSQDELLFNDKEKSILKIEGKTWVKPDLRHQIGLPHRYIEHSVSPSWIIQGGLPSVLKQLHWKPMRKIKLEYSNDPDPETGAPVNPYFYPNQSWIPFVCVYTPNFTNAGGNIANQVKVSYSDCHWFTDS